MSKYEQMFTKQVIQADIIVLGASVSGLVTAYKLKQKFGDSMDIVLLDLDRDFKNQSTFNVTFHRSPRPSEELRTAAGADDILNILSHHHIVAYADEFAIELPDHAVRSHPLSSGMKIFERKGGGKVNFTGSYHGFCYLNILERFELRQLQSFLNALMSEVFVYAAGTDANHSVELTAHDETSMEMLLRACLVLESSREIMRTAVRIVCGAEADKVSVLFYLRQCYRVNGAHNQLDGHNVRTRERVLSTCRKHIVEKLLENTADITAVCSPIWQIRMYSKRKVLLETFKGKTNYVCSVLAMALGPDELTDIRMDYRLLNHRSDVEMLLRMQREHTRTFQVQYEQPFWRDMGFSGDIFSIQGPIMWAMEKPSDSGTGSIAKYFKLVGYLKPNDKDIGDNDSAEETGANEAPEETGENEECTMQEEVVAQLVRLFGAAASSPTNYKESSFLDVCVPLCGDYIGITSLLAAMRFKASMDDRWVSVGESAFIEWSSLNLYGEGDLNASLEAGHQAYVSLLYRLRPQAQSFHDISRFSIPTVLHRLPSRLVRAASQLNVVTGTRLALMVALTCLAAKAAKELIIKLCWYIIVKKLRTMFKKS